MNYLNNVDSFLDDLRLAYQETYNKYGKKQAVGSVLAFLIKNDVSFFTNKSNRDKMGTYTKNDIGYILIEHLIRKISYENDLVTLGINPNVDICDNYNDAKNIVINLLIRFESNKISFGDVMNIIKIIQVHESIFNHLANQFVLDNFVREINFDIDINMPFKISYVDAFGQEKTNTLNGNKIINYVKNEYNLSK